MRLLKKLKLKTKVSLASGTLLILLMTLVIFSVLGIRALDHYSAKYQSLATDEMLLGRIHSNLLESRVAAQSFIKGGAHNQKQAFEERFKKMQLLTFELKRSMHNPRVQKNIEDIVDQSRRYNNDFQKIIISNEKRNYLYEEIMTKDSAIEENLLQVIESAHFNKNEELVYGAGKALNTLLAVRMEVSRFLEINEIDKVGRGMEAFSELDEWIEWLRNTSQSNEDKELLKVIETNKKVYFEAVTEIITVIEERNTVIKEMEKIGTEVSAIVEEINLAIIDEQEVGGPRITKEYQEMIIQMLGLSALAVFLSIAISIEIIRMVVFPIKTVTDTFRDISEGEADLKVRLKADTNDELGEMAKFFNKFMEKLQMIMTENKNQNWIKTGQAELSKKMSGEYDIKALSNHIVSYVARYLNADVGILYIQMEGDFYKLEGVYAYKKDENFQEEIKAGEGIVGEAILAKQKKLVSNVPENYLKISSGMGEALPKNIMIVPCLINDQVVGVMELGTFNEFTPIQLEFLDEACKSIAISICSVGSYIKAQELLHKTIIQSEILQVQQEKFRVTNEELMERTTSLELQKNDINKKNEYLLEAQQLIEEKAEAIEMANKYKSEFLANMSHELRTPLNSILVLSEILANKKDNTPLNEKQLEFASTIHTSGSELLRLINDILDLSKVEIGKMDIHLESMNFKRLADTIEKTFRQIAENESLDFKIVIEEKLPESIVTDEHKVKQIINNLLSNAFKFTEKGEVALKMTYVTQQDVISIAVSDTGIGVREDKQSLIFEAFQQSDGTISRKYGGTGLGLSITKQLVRLLGGRIHLTSEEGVGSTFTVTLPLETKLNNEKENVLEKNILSELAKQKHRMIGTNQEKDESLSEKKILIIDDDMRNVFTLSSILEEKRIKIVVGRNGKEGIDKLKEHRDIDLVLMDIMMSKMDGYTAIKEIRKDKMYSEIPIIALTDKAMKEDRQKCIEAGANDYLSKPIKGDRLISLLRIWLHKG